MSRNYTIGDADATTSVAANAAAPNKGTVVKIPAEAERLDVPKALIDFANSLPRIAAAPLATAVPLVAGTAAVGTGTAAAREDHVHPSELPAHAAADANKLLAVKADGTLEWRAHKAAPTWADIKAGTVY